MTGRMFSPSPAGSQKPVRHRGQNCLHVIEGKLRTEGTSAFRDKVPGSMVSMNNNFRINNILPKLITSKHHRQEFLLGSSIVILCTIKGFASIVYNIQLLINHLS